MYALGTRPLAQNAVAWEYLLPDALGSVRQIVDGSGNVTLAESYEPYGSVLTSTGTAISIFGYSGEQLDTYTKVMKSPGYRTVPDQSGLESAEFIRRCGEARRLISELRANQVSGYFR